MSTIAFTLLWNVGLATMLALLVCLLSRSKLLRHRPGLTHALWLLVLAKFVTPPVIPLPVLPGPGTAAADARTRPMPADSTTGWRQPSPAEHGTLVSSQPVVTSASARNESWSIPWYAILAGVSGCGTLALVTASLAQLVRVSRILRLATSDDVRLQGLARTAASRLAAQAVPAVYAVDASLAPFLWAGWSGPVIVLPVRLIERMDDEQIMCILSHELAHYTRRDHWSNAFAFLVTALFWWHPVTWWARREMRAAQEVCCDGLALATGAASRRCYAETLFQALEFVQANRAGQPALVSGLGTRGSLKRRFEMIASLKVNPRLSLWATAFVVAGSAALLCIPVHGQPKKEVRVLHQGGHVFALAFSQDGMVLASLSDLQEAGKAVGSQVKLWDARSGESKRTVTVQSPHAIESVALSLDGKTLAAGGHSGRITRKVDLGVQVLEMIEGYRGDVKLFHSQTGALAQTLTGHLWDVHFVRFSPDGKTLVAGDRLSTVVHDTDTGAPSRAIRVGAVGAVSADGKLLARLGTDVVHLYDAASGKVKQTLSGHGGQVVFSAAFSPDGMTVATGGGDRMVRLWDARTGVLRRTLEGHTKQIVWSVAFSPDGKTLASGGQDKTVRVWDVRAEQLIRTLAGHSDAVQSVVFSPDGRALATGSADKTVRLWSTRLVVKPD